MKPIVQISLDVVEIDEALQTAAMALRAGVDWLEAGTPLISRTAWPECGRCGQLFPMSPSSPT